MKALCFAVVMLVSSVCQAQYWGWGNGGYHHASTAEEGWRRGQAMQMREFGRMHKDLGRARILNEEAYRKHLENEKLKVETFFDKRIINIQKREEERQARRAVSAVRKQENLEYLSQFNTRPVPSETPHFIKTLVYSKFSHFENADDFMDAYIRGLQGKNCDEYTQLGLIKEIEQMLKKHMSLISPQEYVDCKRYLKSL